MNLLPNVRGDAASAAPAGSSGPPTASVAIIVGAAVLVAVLWYQFDVKGASKGKR